MSVLISIIVPVYHEPDQILDFLSNLKPHLSDHVEIIVVDGAPEKDTGILIHESYVQVLYSKPGRAHQMNIGAQRAKGRYYLFLHVDTMLGRNALSIMTSCLLNFPDIAGGAYDLSFREPGLFKSIFALLASVRTRLTRIPYGDQGIFIRKRVFELLGGYPDFPILEDIGLMKRLKNEGFQIKILKPPVQTSSRRWDKEGWFFRTLQNWWILWKYFRGVSPKYLSKYYRPQ